MRRLKQGTDKLTDPFADVEDHAVKPAAEEEKAKKASQTQNYVHIRVQQRNGRKTLTTLQGLPKGTCRAGKWR